MSGYNDNIFIVKRRGSHYKAFDVFGNKVGGAGITTYLRKRAYDENKAIREYVTAKGDVKHVVVALKQFYDVQARLLGNGGNANTEAEVVEDNVNTTSAEEVVVEPTPTVALSDLAKWIHAPDGAVSLKPHGLMMSDAKWKVLVRNVSAYTKDDIRYNVLLVGHAGGGKTYAARKVAEALNRPIFFFNMGATQDPRATLIGNTQLDPEKGTFFSSSEFVKAIQTEDAIIILDEVTRINDDGANILFPVLDTTRELRLDEAPGAPTVAVHPSVTIVATGNIGAEYTGTRTLDRAFDERFIKFEMDLLSVEDEITLMNIHYGDGISDADKRRLAEIARDTRNEATSDTARISKFISTRTVLYAAEFVRDGFSLNETAEQVIYPLFDNSGGVDSERTYIKQLVQKYDDVSSNETNEY